MTEAIVVAIITGAFALLGTVLTVRAGNEKIVAEMRTQQAVQDTKIEELTREVRQHNEFAVRIPLLEQRISQMEKRGV